jgi:Zn-finger nucleic acid-binding protein
MVSFQLHAVEIDRCLTCGGTWLDTGEVDTLAEQARLPAPDLGRLRSARASGRPTRRRCPRCIARLLEIPIGTGTPLHVDACPREHGLWLDAGEMERLIHSDSKGTEGEVARFFADLYKVAGAAPAGGK